MNINSLDFVYCIFQESTAMRKTMGAKKNHYHNYYHKKIGNGNSSEIFVWSSNDKNIKNYHSFNFSKLNNFDDLFDHFPFFS